MKHKRIDLTREIKPRFVSDKFTPYPVMAIEESERIVMQKDNYIYSRYFITSLGYEIEAEKIMCITLQDLIHELSIKIDKRSALKLCMILGGE